MSKDDPYFNAKEEVINSLNKSRGLYQRWKELKVDPSNASQNDIDWVINELKIGLRTIDWDLEDTIEAIDIVERNSHMFKCDENDIASRKSFIEETKREVKSMRDDIMEHKSGTKDTVKTVTALLNSSFGNPGSTKYSRLQNELESPFRSVYNETGIKIDENESINQTKPIIKPDGNRVPIDSLNQSSLNHHSDEQAVMLDEFGQELDFGDNKLDSPLKKFFKALHLSNERRQWTVIGVFSTCVFVAFILFVTF